MLSVPVVEMAGFDGIGTLEIDKGAGLRIILSDETNNLCQIADCVWANRLPCNPFRNQLPNLFRRSSALFFDRTDSLRQGRSGDWGQQGKG